MSGSSLRIAIADDEVDIRDYLRKVLTRLGHQVVVAAENGPQLVEGALRERPDLVITDLKMAGGDGIEATAQLWQNSAVPVIVISAFPQDIPEWLHKHPLLAAILVKPIKIADLEPVVSQIARQASLRDDKRT